MEQLQRTLAEAIHGLEALTPEQAGQWSRVAWYLLLLIFHRRERSEYTQLQETFWTEVKRSKFRVEEEVAEMAMTMAEFVRAEGRAEGRTEGVRSALISNLEFKFGTLPSVVLAAIERAKEEKLLAWGRQAMAAERLSDVGIAR